MFDISFEINGKKIDPAKIGDVLKSEIINEIKELITESVGDLRCSEHAEAPKIICSGNGLDNLAFKVSGCCDKLIKLVEEKI